MGGVSRINNIAHIIFEELRYSLDERVIKIRDRSLIDEGQSNLLKIWYNGLWIPKERRSQ